MTPLNAQIDSTNDGFRNLDFAEGLLFFIFVLVNIKYGIDINFFRNSIMFFILKK